MSERSKKYQKRKLKIILLLTISCIFAYQAEAGFECDKIMDDYKSSLAKIPVQCSEDSECTLYQSPWNSCSWPHAAKENRDARELLSKVERRIASDKSCTVLHPPCAAIPQLQPRCINAVCTSYEILRSSAYLSP